MAKRFELHLEGMDTPAGLIDADRLVAIVDCLQAMATRIGRLETDSPLKGRPSKELDRVAGLRIGLERGSTTIVAERDTGSGALEFDMRDEESVDHRFADLIESIGADRRPAWVTDSLATSAEKLVTALQQTAPVVEFRVDGVHRRTFRTDAVHRETWMSSAQEEPAGDVTFTGRLFAVDLKHHRFRVEDDAGNTIALPRVPNDREVGRLVGEYVTVTGRPEVDPRGHLTRISDAAVALADDPIGTHRMRTSVPLSQILAGAPGPTPGAIPGLTDTEIQAFLEATS